MIHHYKIFNIFHKLVHCYWLLNTISHSELSFLISHLFNVNVNNPSLERNKASVQIIKNFTEIKHHIMASVSFLCGFVNKADLYSLNKPNRLFKKDTI